MTGRFYLGLVPWVIFAVVVRSGGQGIAWAGLAGAVTATVVTFVSARPGSLKVLNVASVVLFAVLAVAGLLASQHGDTIQRYGRSLSAAGLGLIAFGSLVVAPVAGQYTREAVDESQWGSADFRRGNAVITIVWGVAALAIAVSHAFAGLIDTRQAATVLNWIVPIGVAVVAVHQTIVRSRRYFDEDAVGVTEVAALLDTLAGPWPPR